MKSIHSFFLILCLVIIPLPCLAEFFEASSAPLLEETVLVEVARVPPEISKSEDLRDSIPAGSIDASHDDRTLRMAVVYVPPPQASAGEYAGTIPDPFEPLNRAFFYFNDKLYFWGLRPAASGYSAVVPEAVRVSVRNFFSNVTTPIRLVNCLLQANFRCVGTETLRFFLNTTIGVAGFFDPAKTEFNIERKDKDFGQTLGVYGIGTGFYLVWPILGPSSLRDSFGFVGDFFLDPQNYLITSLPVNFAIKAYDQVNETSLALGEYEDLKSGALDPYTALKDAYFQYRQNKIKEK